MPRVERQAYIVVDLGFGDAGKGSIVDFLTRYHQAHTIVRFNGGAQAAHNVIAPDGRHHTFSQFGSGMFVPGVHTYLSRFMLAEPYAMFNEEAHLRQLGVPDAFSRTALDRDALIITPFQQAANRLRELARGDRRHGSCGVGIGETVGDALDNSELVVRAGDLPDEREVIRKLTTLRDFKWADIEPLARSVAHLDLAQDDIQVFQSPNLIKIIAENYAYLAEQINLVDEAYLLKLCAQQGTIVFEGAQGVLLDQDYGFAPYNTWSRTTFANALDLLAEGDYDGSVNRLGVLRSYLTRHGAGPFVTEDSLLSAILPEAHNTHSEWQQAFRVGYMDLVAVDYALKVAGGADSLAITHVDRVDLLPYRNLCVAYHYAGTETELHDGFEHQGTTITGIRVPIPMHSQHQLAELLFRCTPEYVDFSTESNGRSNADCYIDALSTRLGVPTSILSYGPTADDKQLIKHSKGGLV